MSLRPMDLPVVGGAALCIVAGATILYIGSGNLVRGIESTSWPRTRGVIVNSLGNATKSRASRTDPATTSYSAAIAVSYKVEGREYTTETVGFGQSVGSGDASEAELLLLQYPEGAQVQISHHPHNHALATLEPGFHPDSLWGPSAGLAFLLPGLISLGMHFRKKAGSGSGCLTLPLNFMGVVFCLGGGAMAIPGLLNLWHAHQSHQWPVAPGEIIYAKLDSNESISKYANGVRHRSETFGTRIVYSYEVAGQKRFGNTRRLGQIAGANEDWADEIAGHYPIGRKVEVRYAPRQPQLSVLEPGANWESLLLPGAGAAFFLFGAAVFIWAIPALTKSF